MIDKPPEIPGTHTQIPAEYNVVVPYIDGMLRDETTAAVMAWGGSYTFEQLDRTDPHAYAKALVSWWEFGLDLVVVEQDIVPAPGMIQGLLACPQPWCGHAYHVGEGRYAYGLGLCKFNSLLIAERPTAAMLAMRDMNGKFNRIEWPSVNEAIERQVSRFGFTIHLHEPVVEHLHYPRVTTGEH